MGPFGNTTEGRFFFLNPPSVFFLGALFTKEKALEFTLT